MCRRQCLPFGNHSNGNLNEVHTAATSVAHFALYVSGTQKSGSIRKAAIIRFLPSNGESSLKLALDPLKEPEHRIGR